MTVGESCNDFKWLVVLLFIILIDGKVRSKSDMGRVML